MFNKNQAGLALGSLFALMHFLWVIIIALDFGEGLLDGIHKVHFLSGEMTLLDFNLGMAILGVFLAFISGYITAWVFTCLWNKFARK